ncbi:chaperone protein dnaJ C76, chloroplastic isoform X2 [Mangifera indica]|uniref:chaperone protein dnaJ C76, chloroplastic isoform X2 n=1 Tax=Mangifera indica TaxID=29780 RepID=UPI001CF974FF|nr:chaperone protein dnaJ C76, chloroplastic isoform X2 [Mangifera indica]
MHASTMAAQLPTPVCTDALKFHKPLLQTFSSRRYSSSLPNGSTSWSLTGRGRGRKRRDCGRIKVATEGSASTDAITDDYYAALGLLPDATPEQIKKAYYNCMKACHPDLSGDEPETTNFCMFINEVYAVLSDPLQRMVYDEIHGYALTAINPFLDDSSPKDLAFVDEFSCIGCKNCANVASAVFAIEEEFGRARVYSQCGNPQLVQQAIDSCPVDCIHWTSAAQLSLLEDEMRRVERVNVALMLSGMGSGSMDVFRMASTRWEKRQAKVLQAKIRMMKEKGSEKTESYWSNLWGNPKDYRNSEEEVKERARRAAEAARRWREYSRRGVDKPPTFKLPEATSGKEN